MIFAGTMLAEITKHVQDNLKRREDEANDLFYGTRQPRNITTDRPTRRTKRETRADDSDDAYSSSGKSDVRSRRNYNPQKKK